MLGGVFLISSFLRALLRARSASIRRGCPKEEEKKEREKRHPTKQVGIFVV